MIKRIVIFYGCLLVLGGCAYNDEPMPEIVHSYQTEPKFIQPTVVKPSNNTKFSNKTILGYWLPPSHLEKNWSAIVIHHSGTPNGNAAIFDKWHRENNNWDGVGYDFVIGNGTDSTDGRVEVTFRWQQQITGAHCKTPNNWANEEAVGICLVGNFNDTSPTDSQMRSLLELIRFLQNRYRIPRSRIYGHNTAPGARATDCPGKNFPISKLKSMLDY